MDTIQSERFIRGLIERLTGSKKIDKGHIFFNGHLSQGSGVERKTRVVFYPIRHVSVPQILVRDGRKENDDGFGLTIGFEIAVTVDHVDRRLGESFQSRFTREGFVVAKHGKDDISLAMGEILLGRHETFIARPFSDLVARKT